MLTFLVVLPLLLLPCSSSSSPFFFISVFVFCCVALRRKCILLLFSDFLARGCKSDFIFLSHVSHIDRLCLSLSVLRRKSSGTDLRHLAGRHVRGRQHTPAAHGALPECKTPVPGNRRTASEQTSPVVFGAVTFTTSVQSTTNPPADVLMYMCSGLLICTYKQS